MHYIFTFWPLWALYAKHLKWFHRNNKKIYWTIKSLAFDISNFVLFPGDPFQVTFQVQNIVQV
jgi:hypothetical protein